MTDDAEFMRIKASIIDDLQADIARKVEDFTRRHPPPTRTGVIVADQHDDGAYLITTLTHGKEAS